MAEDLLVDSEALRDQYREVAVDPHRTECVVDVGSAGFDSFIAAGQVGDSGRVIGVDMTPEMLKKSRQTADALGLGHVAFREGLAETLPEHSPLVGAQVDHGAGLLMFKSDPPPTPSAGQGARTRRGPTRCSATPSSPRT